MISIVACCHGAKLCALAARDFRSQQCQIEYLLLPWNLLCSLYNFLNFCPKYLWCEKLSPFINKDELTYCVVVETIQCDVTIHLQLNKEAAELNVVEMEVFFECICNSSTSFRPSRSSPISCKLLTKRRNKRHKRLWWRKRFTLRCFWSKWKTWNSKNVSFVNGCDVTGVSLVQRAV